MKKSLLTLSMCWLLTLYLQGQTLVFNPGNTPGFCGGSSPCPSQPNYDVAANTSNGNLFILKREFNNSTGYYGDEIIKYSSVGTRLLTKELRPGNYKRILADGSGLYVLSVHSDSVIAERYSQSTLALQWAYGIFLGNIPQEAVDIELAFSGLYMASSDAGGLHIRKLNTGTGAVISSVDYNTTFASVIHGLDMASSSNGIFVAGYTSEPGTTRGESQFYAKFSSSLFFQHKNLFNKNLSLTNNSDRASHIRIVNDYVYVCGTSQRSSGDYDAAVVKYNNNGTLQWSKVVNKGTGDDGVDVAIDGTNNDVYLMQNATVSSTPKIFVSRFNSSGTQQWSKSYSSPSAGNSTRGYNIYADPNPDSLGCEIFISGETRCYGPDPHGFINGNNYLFYKYSRSGTRTIYLASTSVFLAPQKGLYQARYFPSYTGGPRLVLLGHGDNSNPSPGYNGWDMYVYDISSTARLEQLDGSAYPQPGKELPISLFPNPASGQVVIATGETMDIIRILDLNGRLVQEIRPSESTINIDLTGFMKGMYLVQSMKNGYLKYTRLMVQ